MSGDVSASRHDSAICGWAGGQASLRPCGAGATREFRHELQNVEIYLSQRRRKSAGALERLSGHGHSVPVALRSAALTTAHFISMAAVALLFVLGVPVSS